jgi:hypothetical protein
MNAERRILAANGNVVAVDSRGNAISPADVDAYLDSVGMPAEFRTRAKMLIIGGHATELPIDGSEQRSADPTDPQSPDFDPQEWYTAALKRSAQIAEELSQPAEETRSLLFDND